MYSHHSMSQPGSLLPNASKPIDGPRCEMIAWNVLCAIATPSREDVRSSMIIREIAQTSRCAKQQPGLQELRDAYKEFMTEETWNKIIRFDALTDQDETRSAQALLHYDTWTRSKLLAEVSLGRKTQYYTVMKAERTFATLGILSTAFLIFSHLLSRLVLQWLQICTRSSRIVQPVDTRKIRPTSLEDCR